MSFHYWLSCAAAHGRETDRQTARGFTKEKVFSFSFFLYTVHTYKMVEINLKTVTVCFSTNVLLFCHNSSSRHYPHCLELYMDRIIGLHSERDSLYMFQILHRQWLFQMTRNSGTLQYVVAQGTTRQYRNCDSPDTVDGTMFRMRPGRSSDLRLIPGRDKRLLSHPTFQNQIWGSSSLLFRG